MMDYTHMMSVKLFYAGFTQEWLLNYLNNWFQGFIKAIGPGKIVPDLKFSNKKL